MRALLLVLALLPACLLPSPARAVPPGTTVINIAQTSFRPDGGPLTTASSNAVSLTTVEGHTPASLDLLRYAPGDPAALPLPVAASSYYAAAGTFLALPPPLPPGVPGPVPLVATTVFPQGDVIFIRVMDPDQNMDALQAEAVAVTVTNSAGDAERILLAETGPSTGVFTGYLPTASAPATPYDGILGVAAGAIITARYTDPGDGADTVSAAAATDPSVFFVRKSSSRASASVGDFLLYTVFVTNTSGLSVPSLQAIDLLPPGFRYRSGSARVDGTAVPDPSVSADGRTLIFTLGALAPAAAAEIRYVAEVGAASRPGKAVNSARAAAGLLVSNTARAEVEVTEDLFRRRGFLMGRVIAAPCGAEEGPGIPGVRIFLEDGTFSVTDMEGRYHFAGVRPGAHVVQVDLATLPKKHRLTTCGEETRAAGRSFSRFVDLAEGTLWRVDFHAPPESPPSPPLSPASPALPAPVPPPPALPAPLPAPPKTGKAGNARLELACVLERSGVEYRAVLGGTGVPLANVRFTVEIPPELVYQPGTSRLGGHPLPEPEVRGNHLTFRLGEIPPDRRLEFVFSAVGREDWGGLGPVVEDIPPEDQVYPNRSARGEMGELLTRAGLVFDTPARAGQRTPLVTNTLLGFSAEARLRAPEFILHPRFATFSAELTPEDLVLLDGVAAKLDRESIVRIIVEGHTDNVPIAVRSRGIYSNNDALSFARARSVARYLAEKLRLPSFMFATDGRGEDEPVAANTTEQGRALNRRVVVRVITEKLDKKSSLTPFRSEDSSETSVEDFLPMTDAPATPLGNRSHGAPAGGTAPSGWLVASASALPPTPPGPERPAPSTPTLRVQAQASDSARDPSWLESASPGFDWVLPLPGAHPPIPSIKVAVKHDPALRVVLLLNGIEVSSLNFTGTAGNKAGTVSVSSWTGVDLKEGDNLLAARALDAAGNVTAQTERWIHYSFPPVTAELVPGRSMLTADGRTAPVVAVRLTDPAGHPAREGVCGEYSVDPPYAPLAESDDPLTRQAGEHPRFTVGTDGIALLRLAPTSRSGEAVLRLNLVNGACEVRAWVDPEARDWILVGLAEGTAGYNMVRGNMESLAEAGAEDRLYAEGRTALYAKGRIRGEWLLTLAYDTARTGKETRGRLHQAVDPGTWYTLYGDASSAGYDAPSSSKLYLKIERSRFYALFGDFDAGLTVTELARYNRSFTGAKTEWKEGRGSLTAFAAETSGVFARDELRGEGTCGLYRLSRVRVIANSEKVALETRDRFHSEAVLSRRELTRHIDYELDELAGTLFFKEPVPARDERFNPVFIVADYETEGEGERSLHYGGRGAWAWSGLTLGATRVHEGVSGGEGNLSGLDAAFSLGDRTGLRIEAAASSRREAGGDKEGSAYLAEVTHKSADFSGRVYLREQDADFGLGAQRPGEAGTRKAGLEGAYRLSPGLQLTGEAYRQSNLAAGADREVAEAGFKYSGPGRTLRASLRTAADTDSGGNSARSSQVSLGGSTRAAGGRLNLHLAHDQSLGSNGNPDYPTRTLLGGDFMVDKDLTLFAEQEFTRGEERDTGSTRLGMRSTPWEGGAATSSVERRAGDDEERLFAVLGLRQTWRLSTEWSFDAGFEQSSTLERSGYVPLDPKVPAASGDGDFLALSLGSAWRRGTWSWNGRAETRDTETGGSWTLVSGMAGEPAKGVGISAGLRLLHEEESGWEKTRGDLRLGFVHRPPAAHWILLDRLDYVLDRERTALADLAGWRLVNNFHANYRPGTSTQWSFQYGSRYARETIDGGRYSGYTDLLGLEARRDLAPRWDIGVRGSSLHAWRAGQWDYGLGVSVGYGLFTNAWLSVGYNLLGFSDRDFSASDFTARGPFVRFRLKFDQASAAEAARALGFSGGGEP